MCLAQDNYSLVISVCENNLPLFTAQVLVLEVISIYIATSRMMRGPEIVDEYVKAGFRSTNTDMVNYPLHIMPSNVTWLEVFPFLLLVNRK